MSIVDVTINILKGMGLEVHSVSTAPGFTGIVAKLPTDAQVFFVWSDMGESDYHFRVARFWESDNPFSMMAFDDLVAAIAKLRILINQ